MHTLIWIQELKHNLSAIIATCYYKTLLEFDKNFFKQKIFKEKKITNKYLLDKFI